MTSKERVLSALNHKQPDQVPMDFGGCTCSCMHVTCVEALREYYGLEKHPVKISEVSTMTGVIEPDLQEAIGVDLEGINGYACSFGFPYEGWKEWDYFGPYRSGAREVRGHPGRRGRLADLPAGRPHRPAERPYAQERLLF